MTLNLFLFSPGLAHSTAVPYLSSFLVRTFLVALHDDLYQRDHFATDKMLAKIRSQYWWPRMRQRS